LFTKTCDQCGATFQSPYSKSRFCNQICTGAYKSSHSTTKKTCPICGHRGRRSIELCVTCRKQTAPAYFGYVCACGKSKAYSAKGCMDCYRTPWTEAEDALVKAKYPAIGAKALAPFIPNHPWQHIQARAYALGIVLTKKARRRLSFDINAERMRRDNPSRRPGATERLRQQAKEHPENLERLFKGHQKLQKATVTKLERKLFAILDDLGIVYESHAMIKPKFIVDVRIGNIIIQADGDWWHGHVRFAPLSERQQKQRARDAAQDTYLHKCGYKVIRIWESDMSLPVVQSALIDVGALIQPMLL